MQDRPTANRVRGSTDMPTEKEVIARVGKPMWERMKATTWLDGITVTINKNGETEIPQSDIDRAYLAATGKTVNSMAWD